MHYRRVLLGILTPKMDFMTLTQEVGLHLAIFLEPKQVQNRLVGEQSLTIADVLKRLAHAMQGGYDRGARCSVTQPTNACKK